jgi:hypothetical protein
MAARRSSNGHFGFVDHLSHARKKGNGFLGKLLLVEGGQPTSQEKHTVVIAVARQLLDGGIRVRP